MRISCSGIRQAGIIKLLPFQGVGLYVINTQGVALGYELLPFQGVWGLQAKLEYIY